MNAKRILNNYRNLGNVKMPRSVYRKGGSKPIPGYRVGGRLRRAQLNTNTENLNSGDNMGMSDLGMMQFLEQNNPFITDESGNQILNPNAVFNPMQYYTLQGAAASGNMDLFNQVLASNLYDAENADRYRNKKKAAKKKDEYVSSFVFGPDQTKQGFGSFLADVAKGFITPENAMNVVGMFQTGQSNKFNQQLQQQMLDAGINPMTFMPITRRRGGTSPSTRLPKNRFRASDPGNNLSPAEVAMLMQGLSGTVGGTTVLPETVVNPTFSHVSSKLLPMEQRFLEEVQTYQPRQLQMTRDELQRLADMQSMYSGFGKSNLSESGIPMAVKRRGGNIKYQTMGEGPITPTSTTYDDRSKRRRRGRMGMGGTAQERVQQMKHGGSMCRGLPGGPNEFPM